MKQWRHRDVIICGRCETEWLLDSGLQICPHCGNDGDIEGHVIRSTESTFNPDIRPSGTYSA